ncbi:unnamed protein product [Cyprideis torosa]|uniref:Uncharacterized protein n=1 Tax=Cyprideis torosa TaxID=163714 RepID=A0A7R8WF82_9CRUS|nr:unnamed protein product [Cyprideis torosa]CAG0890336.1 unnamed protein product [Cyprideis torosa]
MVMVLSGAAKKKKDLKKSSKVLNNGMSAAALESPLQLDNPMNRLSPSETTSNSSISPRGSPESPTPTSPLGIPSPLKRGSYPLTPPPSVGTPPGGPPRSYSDLMRSLAAKYNNNNTETNKCVRSTKWGAQPSSRATSFAWPPLA